LLAIDKSAQKADELDKRLFGLEHGVDLALQRTKVWSKYAKDIAAYLERRAHIGEYVLVDCASGTFKTEY
jgi:uncharacterized protein YlaN (UPF0358 family)